MGIIAGSSRITAVGSGGSVKNTINTQGLIAYYDVTDPACWTSGASTLYDVSPNAANLTVYGSIGTATFGSALGWNFNATGKFFQGSISNTPSKNLTIEAWLYPGLNEVSSGDRGTIVLITGTSGAYMSWNKGGLFISNYWHSHTPNGYHELMSISARESWHHWCSVWDYQQGFLYQYVDGSVGKVGTSGDANTGGTLNIGRESDDRQFSGGIAVIRIYRRALHPEEVYEHWYAEKGRFGL